MSEFAITAPGTFGLGHNRPPEGLEDDRARIDILPVQVEGSTDIRDYPKKFRTSIEQNEKLEACCRKATAHTCRVYKTPTCQEGFPWDLFIAMCKCGRKHRRLLVGETHEFVVRR